MNLFVWLNKKLMIGWDGTCKRKEGGDIIGYRRVIFGGWDKCDGIVDFVVEIGEMVVRGILYERTF